jgi:SagB-type dehydrogenase family enzyme
MPAGPTLSARDYHERTKHSVRSVQAGPHGLDWANQPLPYKIYPALDPIALPREWPASTVPAMAALAMDPGRGAVGRPSLVALARLLHFSAGIVRRSVYAGGREVYYRAAACTGALYHIDLYLVCADVDGLAAGVYHFGPHDFSLRRLRDGDQRGVVVEALGRDEAARDAAAFLVCATTFWRNAWKYRARAYRHAFWDTGTMLANLLAVAAADGVPARVHVGFVDAAIAALTGLDDEREAPTAVVALGRGAPPAAAAGAIAPIQLETRALSGSTIDYPEIRAAHAGSALATAEDVATWRAAVHASSPPFVAPEGAERVPLQRLDDVPPTTIDDVITRRGSTRRFAHRAITAAQLSAILDPTLAPIPADFLGPRTGVAYLIVNAVVGLASGSYVLDAESSTLVRLGVGDHREAAAFLGLGQELPGDASVDVFLLADLDAVLQRLGDRGYRAAQLEAAIVGGRLYLAAYALGLGATGLTFFDDPVTEFFSPHAAGKGVMFLTAIGVPRKRSLPVAR